MMSVTPVAMPGRVRALVAEGEQTYLDVVGSVDAAGLVLTEWRPTTEEIQQLICGARIRVWTQTFGEAFQPVHLDVGKPSYMEES